jgi:NAD(P)-dependent dehydrogenase (short-subunit alcohol dehydrogenase family)
MANRTIIITGASDGIGAAAARKLKAHGENVVVVGRSEEKTKAVAAEIGADYFLADYTRFTDVRKLASDLKAKYPHIDVLMNNAGGIFGDRNRTIDGFEKTLQVNHLSPFLLTNLLMDTLISSKAAVIQTASVAARLYGHLDLDDLNNDKKQSATKAYGDSKLANILFTVELHRRFHGQGLSAASFHPGNVASNFASDTTSVMRYIYSTPLKHLVLIGPDKGSVTMVWLAEGTAGTDWQSGMYYAKKKIAKSNKQAYDAELAKGLWDKSASMVGLASVV